MASLRLGYLFRYPAREHLIYYEVSNCAVDLMKTLTAPLALLFCLISACFIGASFNHSCDIVLGGVFPYRSVPFFFNAFWTSLALVDLSVPLAFLCRKPNLALVLAIIIMTVDVVVNTVFATLYRDKIYAGNIDLIAQTAFLISLLIVVPIAWTGLRSERRNETIESS